MGEVQNGKGTACNGTFAAGTQSAQAKHMEIDLLIGVFTKKRMELLKEINREPNRTMYEISKTLGRDYKNVHQDVVKLERVGFISNDDGLRIVAESLNIQLILD